MIDSDRPRLAIEIGGTKLQICAGTSRGEIVERIRFAVDKKAGGSGIRSHLEQNLPLLVARHSPVCVGVGFGGPVNWQTNTISCSHQIEGWADFPLGQWLFNLTHVPVRVENDANAAALGEAAIGAGTGFESVFYVTLGSGVGGGMVSNKQIYHGTIPGESEIGHLRLGRSGVILEERCSGWAMDGRLREAARQRPDGGLARLVRGEKTGEARFLAAALAQDDEDARIILSEFADDLSLGFSHVTHLFHPDAIILGGGLALVGEPLRRAVEARLPRYIMSAFGPPRLLLSKLKEDAVLVGALLLDPSRHSKS